jgi:hypothetical protein
MRVCVTLEGAAGFLLLLVVRFWGWLGARRLGACSSPRGPAVDESAVDESARASLSRHLLQSLPSPIPLSHTPTRVRGERPGDQFQLPRARATRQEEKEEEEKKKEEVTRFEKSSSFRSARGTVARPAPASPGSPAVARSPTRRSARPGALIAAPHGRGAKRKRDSSEEEALSPPPSSSSSPTLLLPSRARPLPPAFPLPTPLLPTSLRHATA